MISILTRVIMAQYYGIGKQAVISNADNEKW